MLILVYLIEFNTFMTLPCPLDSFSFNFFISIEVVTSSFLCKRCDLPTANLAVVTCVKGQEVKSSVLPSTMFKFCKLIKLVYCASYEVQLFFGDQGFQKQLWILEIFKFQLKLEPGMYFVLDDLMLGSLRPRKYTSSEEYC